jgi:hypothetical protein
MIAVFLLGVALAGCTLAIAGLNEQPPATFEYFCPMHPYIERDDPRYKKCPICLMPFSRQKARPSKLSPEERMQEWRAELAQSRAVIVPTIRKNLTKLSSEDRSLAESQGWCPILEANPLGLLGTPVKITIKDQPVFLCCPDCAADAKKDPEQTLAKVATLKALRNKQHDVKGKIIQITVTIDHEDIPGVLKARRMEFSAEGVKSLESLRSGDLVQGKLKLQDGDYKITELLAAPLTAPPHKKDAEVKELLNERLATLDQLVKATTADYHAGKVPFDRMEQATRALLNARLEQCETDKERIKVLGDIVALAKESEKSAVQRYKSGNAPHSDVLMATAARLEAEIALERDNCAVSAKPK